MVLEVIHIVVNLHQAIVGNSQRTCRGILHSAVQHHLNHCILQHLSIDVEIGHMLILSEGSEDGIGC